MVIIIDPAIHPENIIQAKDITNQRPELSVIEPTKRNILQVLTDYDEVSLISTNPSWDDMYLDGLTEGDWVTTLGVGHDKFPLNEFDKRGIIFTNSRGINSPQIAEHVFAMLFSITRQLQFYRRQQREKHWIKLVDEMTDIQGEICCIIGLGNIGEAVGKRAKAFGMTVRGVKRNTENYAEDIDEVYSPAALFEALDGARLVVICVPLTEQTVGLIGEKELATTGANTIVVNVSRGAVIQTDKLLDSLDSGAIKAACLDVTEPEPLPQDSPLWDRDDVLITPHCAGLSDKYMQRYIPLYLAQHDSWKAGLEIRYQLIN